MTLRSQVATALARHARGGRLHLDRVVGRVHAGQNVVLANVFRPYGVTVLYVTFGLIFFYFGMQKPSPATSPVRVPLTDFFAVVGIPVDPGMYFIGTYEMFLGLLFLFKQLRAAFWLFLPHQLVTFLSLAIIPFVAFQPPFLTLFGVDVPVATTGYGEFVLKNVVFVAGFMLLAAVELGDGFGTTGEQERSDA